MLILVVRVFFFFFYFKCVLADTENLFENVFLASLIFQILRKGFFEEVDYIAEIIIFRLL